ncbi:MAG: SAF domain-containing protein, partial [Nocardioidaceae bacterium]
SQPSPGPGQREVGVELDGTRAPAGLGPGDVVAILAVPPSGDTGAPNELDSPPVLSAAAAVVSVETIQGAGTRFTLLVSSSVANRVAAYGAAGRVAIIQAPVGGDH